MAHYFLVLMSCEKKVLLLGKPTAANRKKTHYTFLLLFVATSYQGRPNHLKPPALGFHSPAGRALVNKVLPQPPGPLLPQPPNPLAAETLVSISPLSQPAAAADWHHSGAGRVMTGSDCLLFVEPSSNSTPDAASNHLDGGTRHFHKCPLTGGWWRPCIRWTLHWLSGVSLGRAPWGQPPPWYRECHSLAPWQYPHPPPNRRLCWSWYSIRSSA